MSLPRFFLPPELLQEGEVLLPPEEARHAAGARRLGEGDAVEVLDGAGRRGEGTLSRVSRKEVALWVTRIVTEPRPSCILEVWTAVPKGKRWQVLVEKCTELGADVIQPMTCARSVVKPEGTRIKWDRWALEACKQAGRVWAPRIPEPRQLREALHGADLLVMADPGGGSAQDLPTLPEAGLIRLLVGPEGGFCDDEAALIREAGGRGLCLGPHILRIETAAIGATAVMGMLRRAHG